MSIFYPSFVNLILAAIPPALVLLSFLFEWLGKYTFDLFKTIADLCAIAWFLVGLPISWLFYDVLGFSAFKLSIFSSPDLSGYIMITLVESVALYIIGSSIKLFSSH